jgi:iron complex transport system substrate-binding protein
VRICSLLASATEILASLGLVGSLCAVSQECDRPPEVRRLPTVTTSRVETSDLSSIAIDRALREAVAQGRPLYAIERELLERLEPDLILTQNLCAVCAVAADAIGELCVAHAEVVALDAQTLAEIRDRILSLADLLGVPERGRAVVDEMQAKLAFTSGSGMHRRRRCSSPNGSTHPTPPAIGSRRWSPSPAAMCSDDQALPPTQQRGSRRASISPNSSSPRPAASTTNAQPAKPPAYACRSIAERSPSTGTPTRHDPHHDSPTPWPNSPTRSTPTSPPIPASRASS